MNLKRKLCFVVALLVVLSLNAQSLLPVCKSGSVIKKSYYTLCYDESNEQADWVYYELTYPMIVGSAKRANNFRSDPDVKTGSASIADYAKSGYDRGHLCPAAAMKLNQKAMSETFYMSNMSPQKPYFNRGIWKKLEAKVRTWIPSNGKLYVVSGPIFKDDLGTIGANKVTIPGYYYKVIYNPQNQTMIGFVLRNEKSSLPLVTFVTTVDQVEQLTGIDFFSGLNDQLENRLEGEIDTASWSLQ